MRVSSDSWHARIYRSWYRRKYGYGPDFFPPSSNLCPYMRAVIFWSWMRPLFLTRIGYFTYPLLLIEIPRWLGMVSYTWKIALFKIYAVAAAIVVVVALVAGIKWLYDRNPKPIDKIGSDIEEFGDMVKAWGRSAHDGVCPQITFTK